MSKRNRELQRILSEQDAVYSRGETAIKSQLAKMSADILRAYSRRSLDFAPIVDTAIDGLQSLLTSAILDGYLTGWVGTMRNAAKHSPGTLQFAAYDDHVSYLQDRASMSEEDIDVLRATFGAVATDVFVGAPAKVNSRLRTVVSELTERGALQAEAITVIRQEIATMGYAPASPWTVETVWRTQSSIAHGAGRWEALNDPVVNDMLWGYEYNTVGDDRVRPKHAELDGMKLPKDHPRWQDLWPPNGYNCRCVVLEVFTDEAPSQASKVPAGAKPDKGFDFPPGQTPPAGSPSGGRVPSVV